MTVYHWTITEYKNHSFFQFLKAQAEQTHLLASQNKYRATLPLFLKFYYSLYPMSVSEQEGKCFGTTLEGDMNTESDR